MFNNCKSNELQTTYKRSLFIPMYFSVVKEIVHPSKSTPRTEGKLDYENGFSVLVG